MSDDDELLEMRREAARNDASRAGRAVRLGETNEPKRIVPCRACGVDVEISAWVVEVARQFDDVLARRGERPLEDGELTMCGRCAGDWGQRKFNTAVQLAEAVQRVVRDVKAGRDLNADQLSWLRHNGYGDTADGMEAIMRRRAEAALKNERKAAGE